MIQNDLPPFTRHLAPIIEAARTKGLRAAIFLSRTPAVREMITLRAPAVVIVGDDLDVSEGPGAFHRGTLRAALGRATHVAVMAGAPMPSVYKAAAMGALMFGAVVVLVECSERTEADWHDAMTRWARKASKLLVSPGPEGAPVH